MLNQEIFFCAPRAPSGASPQAFFLHFVPEIAYLLRKYAAAHSAIGYDPSGDVSRP